MFTVGSILGTGHFGSVYIGEASSLIYPDSKTKVAVKTVNDVLDMAQFQVRTNRFGYSFSGFTYVRSYIRYLFCCLFFLQSLFCEMKIMTNLKLHLNLVNLVGSCTAELDSRNLWLLLEFCPHGDLKNFLIKNRQQFKNNIKGETSVLFCYFAKFF